MNVDPVDGTLGDDSQDPAEDDDAAEDGSLDVPVEPFPEAGEEQPEEPAGDDTGWVADPEDERFFPDWPDGMDPFADAIVSFEPGPDAGFGIEEAPDIVLGWPEGNGEFRGSLDVRSLGESGEIVLEMNDLAIFDGPGPDLLVFENPFSGWLETGAVAVSSDGEEWLEWPCDALDDEALFPGCAGVGYVYADSSGLIDPTDPDLAGGDAFDLVDLGVDEVRFIRIRDSGFNDWAYGGTTGGFDLDAVAAVNWRQIATSD